MADISRHIKNRFCHNSTADCPISVKFCVGSSFSQNFDNGTAIPAFHRTYFVFLMQFGQPAPFVSSPIYWCLDNQTAWEKWSMSYVTVIYEWPQWQTRYAAVQKFQHSVHPSWSRWSQYLTVWLLNLIVVAWG